MQAEVLIPKIVYRLIQLTTKLFTNTITNFILFLTRDYYV